MVVPPAGVVPGGPIADGSEVDAGKVGPLCKAVSTVTRWLMPEPMPTVDWAVAYWNLVDAGRYARAAALRNAPPRRVYLSVLVVVVASGVMGHLAVTTGALAR